MLTSEVALSFCLYLALVFAHPFVHLTMSVLNTCISNYPGFMKRKKPLRMCHSFNVYVMTLFVSFRTTSLLWQTHRCFSAMQIIAMIYSHITASSTYRNLRLYTQNQQIMKLMSWFVLPHSLRIVMLCWAGRVWPIWPHSRDNKNLTRQ